jgi:hypothetical protein
MVLYRHVDAARYDRYPAETTLTVHWHRIALFAAFLYIVTAAIGRWLAIPHGSLAFLAGVGVACGATYAWACWRSVHSGDPFIDPFMSISWTELIAQASFAVGAPSVLAALFVVVGMKLRHRAALHAPGFEVLPPASRSFRRLRFSGNFEGLPRLFTVHESASRAIFSGRNLLSLEGEAPAEPRLSIGENGSAGASPPTSRSEH